MSYNLKHILFFLIIGSHLFAQTKDATSTSAPTSHTSSENTTNKSNPIINPTITLGVGVLNFYGDLYQKKFQPPMLGRLAYEVGASQSYDYLQLNFYMMFGKLGANERLTAGNRNLNFESQIRTGGINVAYNFAHFLPKRKSASPYVSLGVEHLEFLSKTDLVDQYGNAYNYWSDGTIRNLPEVDPNAANSIIIHRDYTYESDIRTTNIDGFGKYKEQSWAIPVGAGVMFKISDKWSCKLGTAMHFTFTDYIDGISDKSIGDRVGNKKNDHFMMSSFSLSYNFGSGIDELSEDNVDYSDVDFLALEMNDSDEDGVQDSKDSCAGTPLGMKVDERGCPFDDDNDGVPNEKDKELSTPAGALVDINGVQMSDSLLAYHYKVFSDSTGEFAETIIITKEKRASSKGTYTVQLGTYKKGVSPEIMTKILSIKDVSTTSVNDSTTVYAAGTYNMLTEAETRKEQLIKDGFPDAMVVFKQNGQFSAPPKVDPNATAGNTTTSGTTSISVNEALNTGAVLRVQLGAYRKRLSKNVFKGINDLIEIETTDGLFKYMTGSFKTFPEAAKHKTEMILKGYEGAFITAYKGGGRITLLETGATPAKKGGKIEEIADNVAVNAVDKKLLVFKVQIGIFKNDPPDEKLELFTKIPDVKGEKTASGITIYTAGNVRSYKQAEALKEQLIKKYKIEEPFVVAYYNGSFIPIQEALELEK
jgi:hypothetical protein